MAGTTISISSTSFQGANNAETLTLGPLSISITAPVLQNTALTFGSGTFISTTGPIGATVCIIAPPTGNGTSLTLKGITGDTGIPIHASNPTLVSFAVPASANIIGLTSASAITGAVQLLFF